MPGNMFRCGFEFPEMEIADPAVCRAAVIAAINDETTQTVISDLEVASRSAQSGPAPRGGEAGMSCHADSHGGWGCEGHVSIRF